MCENGNDKETCTRVGYVAIVHAMQEDLRPQIQSTLFRRAFLWIFSPIVVDAKIDNSLKQKSIGDSSR